MKTFIFTYLGGLVGSIPAFTLFNNVGLSPFSNYQVVNSKIGNSLEQILLDLFLIWVVPAFGAAIGAKLGGHAYPFYWIYGHGIGGQVVFSIGFGLLIVFVASINHFVFGLPPTQQTIVFLMASQAGCTLSALWGM